MTAGETPLSAGSAAQETCVRLVATMEALLLLTEEEATLVRSGRLFAIADLKGRESMLVKRYADDLRWLESNTAELEAKEPRVLEWVRRRHAAFRSIMRINLAALATARELAEMRLQEVTDRVRPVAGKPSTRAA